MPTLAAARRGQLLSQRALAEKAGVSQATLVAIERGAVQPSLRTMAKVAAALGVEPADIDEFARAITSPEKTAA